MIQNILKQLSPRIKSRINFTSYPHCGRDICYCLYDLNLNNKEDKLTYETCYDIWFNFHYKDTVNRR